ncbi:MAG: MobF family relaxase [Opitutaceae bacterium]|nr:MobF family relaxase [Opitutaceae bacterium]
MAHPKGIVALRINVRKSANAAEEYYLGLLDRYYRGLGLGDAKWLGKGCEILGLKGEVTKTAFAALVRNYMPDHHTRLTSITRADRRAGCDVNHHATKSLSVMALVLGDQRLCTAFTESSAYALARMEPSMQARVRSNKADHDRLTGNMVCASFPDFLSRPVKGKSDPHLHNHNFLFNATFDFAEGSGKWKAAQMGLIIENAPVYQAIFYADLARRAQQLGYRLVWDGPRWEIEGVSAEVIELFSRRSRGIEKEAEERGIWSDREKSQLGARLREGKSKNIDWDCLISGWKHDLGEERLKALSELKDAAELRASGHSPTQETVSALDALALATARLACRMAVWTQREFIAEALLAGRGEVTIAEVERALPLADPLVGVVRTVHEDRESFTTPRIMCDIETCIRLASAGKGKFDELGQDPHFPTAMTTRQRDAVEALVSSRDFLSVIHATDTAARLVIETVRPAVAAENRQIVVLGVRPACVRMLQASGFADATTVDDFLRRPPPIAKGTAIWVHDAAFLSSDMMVQLCEFAQRNQARVVMVQGNSFRSSIDRGNALRLVTTRAELNLLISSADQSEAGGGNDQGGKEFVAQAGGAASDIIASTAKSAESTGVNVARVGRGFAHIDPAERTTCAVEKFTAITRSGASCMAMAEDYPAALAWTESIRAELVKCGFLDPATARPVETLITKDVFNDELSAAALRVGDTIELTTDADAGKRGERLQVCGTETRLIVCDSSGEHRDFQPENTQFNLFRPLSVAVNDRLRITRTDIVHDRLFIAGEIVVVREHLETGDLRVGKTRLLPKDFKHLTYGWVDTPSTVERISAAHLVLLTSDSKSPGDVDALLKSKQCVAKRIWHFCDREGLFLPRGLRENATARNDPEEVPHDWRRQVYYLRENTRVDGPFPVGQMQRLIDNGQLTPSTEVSTSGVDGWHRADEDDLLCRTFRELLDESHSSDRVILTAPPDDSDMITPPQEPLDHAADANNSPHDLAANDAPKLDQLVEHGVAPIEEPQATLSTTLPPSNHANAATSTPSAIEPAAVQPETGEVSDATSFPQKTAVPAATAGSEVVEFFRDSIPETERQCSEDDRPLQILGDVDSTPAALPKERVGRESPPENPAPLSTDIVNPPPAAKPWRCFVMFHEHSVGPFSPQQIEELVRECQIVPTTQVSFRRDGPWNDASSITAIAAMLEQQASTASVAENPAVTPMPSPSMPQLGPITLGSQQYDERQRPHSVHDQEHDMLTGTDRVIIEQRGWLWDKDEVSPEQLAPEPATISALGVRDDPDQTDFMEQFFPRTSGEPAPVEKPQTPYASEKDEPGEIILADAMPPAATTPSSLSVATTQRHGSGAGNDARREIHTPDGGQGGAEPTSSAVPALDEESRTYFLRVTDNKPRDRQEIHALILAQKIVPTTQLSYSDTRDWRDAVLFLEFAASFATKDLVVPKRAKPTPPALSGPGEASVETTGETQSRAQERENDQTGAPRYAGASSKPSVTPIQAKPQDYFLRQQDGKVGTYSLVKIQDLITSKKITAVTNLCTPDDRRWRYAVVFPELEVSFRALGLFAPTATQASPPATTPVSASAATTHPTQQRAVIEVRHGDMNVAPVPEPASRSTGSERAAPRVPTKPGSEANENVPASALEQQSNKDRSNTARLLAEEKSTEQARMITSLPAVAKALPLGAEGNGLKEAQEYYLRKGLKQEGPCTFEEIRTMIEGASVDRATQVRKRGVAGFKSADKFDELLAELDRVGAPQNPTPDEPTGISR